ncbi:hypothetical protein Taro_029374 [Colocasia esculenta]|uniref:Uncharacterized protein n=1 Tax=Colocasia esculenta TaxID=4460 RepID=A0A843VUP6_COLES|nr:hypothetical protein [Colocasia esculenta]
MEQGGGGQSDLKGIQWVRFFLEVHGGIDVCGFPTSQCVRGSGRFCLWALTLWRSEVAMLVVRHPSHVVAWWSPGSSSRELDVGRVAEAALASCATSSSEGEFCELLYLSDSRVVLCKFSGPKSKSESKVNLTRCQTPTVQPLRRATTQRSKGLAEGFTNSPLQPTSHVCPKRTRDSP